MAPKPRPIDTADAVRRYESGEPYAQIARSCGVKIDRMRAALVDAGVTLRPRGGGVGHAVRDDVATTEDCVRLYAEGLSAEAIAAQLGCSRGTVQNRLHRAGVQMRSGLARVERAHAAVRGMERTVADLETRAIGVQAKPGENQSSHEVALASMLRDLGIETVPQLAVGVYNVDLAAAPVAVEVFGGNWHFSKDHRQRFRDLADRGWFHVVVWVDPNPRHSGLHVAAAQQVVRLVEVARRDPPALGQYWMVRGTGEVVAAGNVYADDFAFVRPRQDTIVDA